MNAAISTFKLIIVNDSPQEAQRLSSMLQNAGKPCLAKHINSSDGLAKALEEQDWDLVIAHDDSELLAPSVLIRDLRKNNKDIAVILLTEEINSKSIVDGMKLGACDVAQLDDDQHLLLIITRELENRRDRLSIKRVEGRLKAVERRNQKLLDSSRDGIAFIQDGMFLYANESFAEMLDRESRDDIEFMPVMDTIIEEEHQHIKKILKGFSVQRNSDSNKQLSFTAVLPDETTKKINAELFVGEHEGEPCIQLICYAKLATNEVIEAELQNIKSHDLTTGLYNRSHLIDEIERIVAESETNKTAQAFMYIDIDEFSKKIKAQVGITDSDLILKKVADFIQYHYPENSTVARISDHSFGVITEESEPGRLIDINNELCKTIADHIFEVGNKTVKATLSIGICLIDEETIDYHSVINHSIQAADALRKSQNGNGSNLYQKDAQENRILAGSLRTALENDDFLLLFQPILSLRGEDTERYEVLLRMVVEEKELSPTHFFAIADSLKLSKKIDRWVIIEAIKQLKINQKRNTKTQLFINLSTETLCDRSFFSWLKVAINAAEISGSCITFQARESEVLQHLTAIKQFTEKCTLMGIEFCITNFGVATKEDQSSILELIEAKYIKINGLLSQELQNNPENSQEVEALVQQLHAQNKITTIPLIEKASVLSKLWQLGVHYIQGNYLQPPQNVMDYEFTTDN